MKTLKIFLLLILSTTVYSKQISRSYKIDHSNISVIKGYDTLTKRGEIAIKLCASCPQKSFTLTDKSHLLENGIEQPIRDLLKVKLSNPSNYVLVQVNTRDNTVYFIEWGFPKGEEGEE